MFLLQWAPVCVLTTNFLGPRAKCATQCIHTPSTLILRILPKTSTFYSLAPCSKFCACAQAQISHHAKILKTEQQQNMDRTHGSDIDTQTLNKFLSIIFPFLSQNRLQFSPPGSIWAWQEVMIFEVKNVFEFALNPNPLFWPDNVVHLYNIKLLQKLQDDLSATANQSLVFLSAIANQSLVFPSKQWFLLRRRRTTMVLFHWD